MKGIKTKICSLLLITLISIGGYSQDIKTISGNVTDIAGEAIPGASVSVKGTSNGVATDNDGFYSLRASEGDVISFSFIGMKTYETSVGAGSIINAILRDDDTQLDDIVIVGYGEQKRENITSAVETIDMEEIKDLPVGNLASALVGRVLGVSVSGGESRPGAGGRITIRNPYQTTAKDGGTTDPLYVIDGVIQVDPSSGFNDSSLFNTLDASQIESISFLKDASAAIYGARATQGVILVKTKTGKIGPAKVSYSGNFSVADENYRTRMMNAYEFGLATNIMNGPNGAGHEFDPNNPTPDRNYFFTPNELDHFRTLNHDFLEDNWTSATTQRHNVNISGGGENGTFFGGISYYTQEGNLGTLNYDRMSFRAGSSVNLAKGLTANFQVSGYFTDEGKTFNKVGSEDIEDDFQELQNRAPFLPMYINGLPANLATNRLNSDKLLGYHYEEIQRLQNLAKNKDNNVTLNAFAEYEIPFMEGLKVSGRYARTESKARGTQLGFRYNLYQFNGPNDVDDYIYYESGSGPLGENTIDKVNQIKNGDRIAITNSTTKREQMNFQTTYARDFGLHSVSALFSIEKSESEFFKDRIIKENGVPIYSTGMLWEVPNDGADYSNTYNWRNENGDLGYIGRLNYNYDEKYLAEFLFRSDASAKFAPQNYWGEFYSLSAGWIISKENFFKSKNIDFLKVRGSVGKLGKDDVKAFSYLQQFGFQIDKGAVFGGDRDVSPGLRTGTPANPDIKWSDEIKTNLGIEAKFFDNKLSTNFEQYYNTGTNILTNLNQAVPFTVGGGTTPVNYAEVNTWGTELSVRWHDYIGNDFRYQVTLNTGWSDNKIIKGDFGDISTLKPWDSKPGESSDNGVWGYDFVGMFKTQADIDNYLAETGITQILGKTTENLRPGMLYYRDVRGEWDPETRTFAEPDGIVNENDQVQLKERSKGPTGFSTVLDLSYKQFSLNSVLSTNWGGYSLVGGTARSRISQNAVNRSAENRPAFWANQYDPELNPSGTIPNLSKENSNINMAISEYWKVSNFNFSIRNINLSYSLPKNIAESMMLSNVRLNLVAINPFILYNPYKDYGLPPNGTYDRYPVLKTYSLGLNIGF